MWRLIALEARKGEPHLGPKQAMIPAADTEIPESTGYTPSGLFNVLMSTNRRPGVRAASILRPLAILACSGPRIQEKNTGDS